MPAAITVIGDALLDVLTRPDEPLRAGGDVVGDIRIAPGGQGANVAVRLARRGRAVRLVTGIADDPAGRLLREALATEGVELVTRPVDGSGLVVALIDGRGERSMISRRPVLGVGATDLPPARPGEWVVLSGYALLEPEVPPTVTALGSTAARRALLGCAVPDRLTGAWQEAATALRPDLVVLNRDEWGRLPISGTVLTVVTDAAGASAELDGARLQIRRAAPEDAVVDTTGAGDALAATLLHALADRWPPDEATVRGALSEALAAAGEVTRAVGAQVRIASEGTG